MSETAIPQISHNVGGHNVPESTDATAPQVPGWEAWWTKLKAAEEYRGTLREKYQWEKNVKRYCGLEAPVAGQDPSQTANVQVNKDFALTEQKIPQLFFQSPDVQLTAKQPGLEQATVIFQAVLNDALGAEGVNAIVAVREVLFDVECPAGIGAVKIGYEATVGQPPQILVPTGRIDPTTQQAAIDPATGQPEAKPAPNIIAERYFYERIPVGKLLIPVGFHGLDFDKAPWLGFEFGDEDETTETAVSTTDEKLLNPLQPKVGARKKKYEVWARDTEVLDLETGQRGANPEKFVRLLFEEGKTEPVQAPDCPYQDFDERGRLIGGMRGNPINPLTLRYVSDSSVPPSDCWISRRQVDELSRSRSLMLQHRDRSLPMNGYNATSVMPADLEKIVQGKVGQFVGFNGPLKDDIWPIRQGEHPRDNFTFNEIINDDIVDAWALRNSTDFNSKTATESSYQQGAQDVRLDAERAHVLRWHLRNVAKLAALIQKFADQEDYVRLEGQDAQKLGPLVPWDRTKVQGRFAFTAKPDSAIRVDAAKDRKDALDFINYTIKSPYINQAEALTWLAQKFNLDPAKVLTQPPPPKEEKPSVSWSIKPEDFTSPAAPIAAWMSKLAGWEIPPAVLEATKELTAYVAARAMAEATAQQQQQAQGEEGQPQGQQPHGGAADKADPINKHQSDQTGGMQGIGAIQ